MQWLSWDGRRLRWQLDAQAARAAVELHIDGIAFQRFAVDGSASARVIECEFAFSPSGREELEFSIAAAGAESTRIGAAWRVRYAAAAATIADQWTQAPRGLASLADTPRLPAGALSELPAVAIVVPIYNSPQCVQRCIEALLRWTPPTTLLILIDDASTDAQISTILAGHRFRDNILIQRNPDNRGYTHSINVGMHLAGDADVVLLNSDTEVGPRWLQSLRLAAYGDATIGTATAVSDNAGAFSVPELEQFCPIPERWNLPMAQRAVLQHAGQRFPELPTGNGFCMLVKRKVIERIGLMDEEAFPAGYGEENDFCQRAQHAGFRHIIAGNVLVHHERSASFGDTRRAALSAQGMAVLRQRYPDYEAAVGTDLYSFERRVLDYRVRRIYADIDGSYTKVSPRPRVLVAAAENQVEKLQPSHEIFALQDRIDGLQLLRYRHADSDAEPVDFASAIASANNRDITIRNWLVNYAIEAVCVDTADAIGTTVARLATALDIPLL